MYLEHPGNKLSNRTLVSLRKEFNIKEPFVEVCSGKRYYGILNCFRRENEKAQRKLNEFMQNWKRENGDMPIPADVKKRMPKVLTTDELRARTNCFIERERDKMSPYKAIMVVRENQTEIDYASRLTDDSLVIVQSMEQVNFSYFRTFTPVDYIKWCEKQLNNDLADFIEDDDKLLDLDIKQARFDFSTNMIHLEKPNTCDSSERILSPYFYPREFHLINNFDMDSREIHIKGKFFSDREKNKIMSARITNEELDFYNKRYNDLMSWLETLPEDKRAEVLSWYENPDLKECESCGHKYSNDQRRCPVCKADNETFEGDWADRNPDWFDEDGNWWGNPEYDKDYLEGEC